MLHSKVPCMHSYSTSDVIDAHENRDSYVFKKFINAAIYVEKSFKKLGPDLNLFSENMKIKKTKRCTCSIDADSCFFHPSMASGDGLKYTKSENMLNFNGPELHQQLIGTCNEKLIEIREKQKAINTKRLVPANLMNNNKKTVELKLEQGILLKADSLKIKLSEINDIGYQRGIQNFQNNIAHSEKKIDAVLPRVSENPPKTSQETLEEIEEISDNKSTSSEPSSSTLTGCTVKPKDNTCNNNMKISLSSLTSCRLSENESVKQWLTRKLEEQRKRQITALRQEKRKEIERQKILEKERENFKLWLAEKKKMEEKKKAELEKQQELANYREAEREKRYLENQLRYELWLKRKQVEKLEKENKEHLKVIQDKMNKERRMIVNREAFDEWMQSAKDKPKPIPLNRGLDSLRSSVSVTYINPVPWVPNIIDQKPASQ